MSAKAKTVQDAFSVIDGHLGNIEWENGAELAESIPLGGVDDATREIMEAVQSIQQNGSHADKLDQRYKLAIEALQNAHDYLVSGELATLKRILGISEQIPQRKRASNRGAG